MHALLPRSDFDAAFCRLRDALTRHATRLVHPQDADDVTQQTYVLAATLLERYDADTGPSGLLRWLLSLLTNLCHEATRQSLERNEELLPPDALEEAVDAQTDTNQVEEDLNAWCEGREMVRRANQQIAVLRLSPRRQQIWSLWQNGHTQVHIAQVVGIKRQSVAYHLSVIFTQLRAAKPDLIGPADGYKSTLSMFGELAKATRYHRPQRRGSFAARQALKRLK